jgi:RNA polymerase sigma factor (sigma-70 family)
MLSKHEQDILVTSHLDVVKWIIRKQIFTDENRRGLEYDDLFQEGCIWLCKAAATYNAEIAGFETYAKKVVRNGLFSYCRSVSAKNKIPVTSLDAPIYSENENEHTLNDELSTDTDMDEQISLIDTLSILESMKYEYHGTVRDGIEALEWRVKGYSVTEIADMYGVKPNLIGAKISRAAQKLRNNPKFAEQFGYAVEKEAA